MTTLNNCDGTVMPTNIEGVDFVIRFRYAGKRLPIPYFRVKLDEKTSQENNSEYSYVSIAKHGWRKAWKKSLLSLTVNHGRSSVVRFLNKPPKESEYHQILSKTG